MKVLALMDYVARTGFGTVSKNIVAELKKNFGAELKLDIIAINYFGEPYQEDENTYVVSGKLLDVDEDDFGRKFFNKMLSDYDYDGVFICQDLGVIVPTIELMRYIKKKKKEKNTKSFKSIFYFPVDCHIIKDLTKDLEFFDILVTYTEFGRNEILKFRPDLRNKLKVISHGNNSKDFYPLPEEERLKFRKEYFGDNADKLIVTSVNRNQPRKDIPNTIFGFIEAKELFKENPDLPQPFLYLHMHPQDPLGWDLRGILLQTNLIEDVDYKLLPKEYEQEMCDLSTLNAIYNASDVCLSTTLGEGWGLCQYPSTKILIQNGVKDIDSVIVGDMVLTNDGKYHEVLDTTKRKVNSYRHIQTKYGYFLKATHEHPYFVLSKDGKISWKKVSEISNGDSIGIRKAIGDKPIPDFIDLADYLPKNEGWIIEDDLVYHLMGFSPKNKTWSYAEIIKKYKTTKKVAENAKAFISGKKKSASFLCIELVNKMLADGYIKQDGVNKIKRKIKITDDLLWLFGVYLGDGCSSNSKVEFCLNSTTKKETYKRVKDIIFNSFGITCESRKRKICNLDIIVSSRLLENFFKLTFGNGAFNKSIPQMLNGCEWKLMPLVKGLFNSDGHINLRNDTISLSTVSPSLAYQIQSVLASNNIFISVHQKPVREIGNYDIYHCAIPSGHLRRFMDATGMKGVIDRDNKRNHKPDFTETPTHFFVPVKSIKEIHEETEMYDLCVEGSHSFIGNGLVCHNTFSEAASCKVPIIAPYTTSFMEMSNYGKNAYMLKTIYPYCSSADNIIREQTDIYEIADQILIVAKNIVTKDLGLLQKIDASYAWANKLEWSEICKQWVKYFKEFK